MPERVTGCLPKQEIQRLVVEANLITGFDKDQLQPSSYDLRIGTVFKRGQVICEGHPEAQSQIILDPGELISLFTEEELNLPNDICATAFAINEQSSRGLLVLNPGHIDPGFSGPLSLRVLNLRRTPLAISRGMSVFTAVFERLTEETTTPYAKNLARPVRERKFNQGDVETSPGTLSQLVQLGRDAPYPNRTEVREMIVQHWMSWTTIILAGIAAAGAIVSIALTIASHQSREPLGRGGAGTTISINEAAPPSSPADTTAGKRD